MLEKHATNVLILCIFIGTGGVGANVHTDKVRTYQFDTLRRTFSKPTIIMNYGPQKDSFSSKRLQLSFIMVSKII